MDIVERLRGDYSDERLELAADEIERLRGIINDDRLEGAADEIERLRKALQLIADPLRGPDVTHYLVVASYQSIARNALGGSDV